MSRAKVLFVASEIFPFAKSGGLADVAYSLPRALSQDFEMHVVMPLYQFVDRYAFHIVSLEQGFEITLAEVQHHVNLYGCEIEGIYYLFIESPLLCDRETLYGSATAGYEDNDLRFALFAKAVAALALSSSYALIHLNDWQSALTALYIKNESRHDIPTIFTIHNLAYQGVFPAESLERMGLDQRYFHMDALEFYHQVNFMKAGIAYADLITTVSPHYAKEILTKRYGCGLEGFLQHHQEKLDGIINGIDTQHFSPSSDSALKYPYTGVRGKGINKKAYLKEVGLAEERWPLFIFIGRFTWQKGLTLLAEVLPTLATLPCQIAIIGEGEEQYHQVLQDIASAHDNIALDFGYDESRSHRMYAAADFLLMPSLFEPCGLNQLIAMHYGALPIVHRVGGLADSVHDISHFDDREKSGYGLCFDAPNQEDFLHALHRALEIYAHKANYSKIVKHNMKHDVSWKHSGALYKAHYEKLITK